ncbi:hypothetical protein B0A48_07547 [Cryoendolithus antarcticus]|uniref:Rpr2-domain-containing protein n=1 Tax=Cryoendolithus antarcticus TaxID=1507870 RepID=A0A1V8T6U2_9PEZI|nr:hypothetical protein B0A48_07547 [Cryoendolithus antarcticus]
MGKGKNSKGAVSKHSQARIDHLQRIAQYLTKQALSVNDNPPSRPADDASPPNYEPNGLVSISDENKTPAVEQHPTLPGPVIPATAAEPSSTFPGLPNLYTVHLTSIARKTQIRLPPRVKHGICKRCSSPLLSGLTSNSRIENSSRGGSKSWADVRVVDCSKCGAGRRVPVGAKRQEGKAKREGGREMMTKTNAAVPEQVNGQKWKVERADAELTAGVAE